MFAKHWRPGTVKTRLAETIGQAAAASLYRTFLSTLLVRFQAMGERRLLVYTPADKREVFRALAGDAWLLEPQGTGDLGRRMECYFEGAAAAGVERAVLIGSDSPNLPVEFVGQAFRLLESHDVVLGPATDGGYYLVGMRGTVPPCFEGIAWGTAEVWQQTVDRLERQSSRYATLPPWYDVDVGEDLRRLASDLSSSGDGQWGELAALRAVVMALMPGCER
jgi:rSAM/selenodomain-associated transferase 1